MKFKSLVLLFLLNFSFTLFANSHLVVHYWSNKGSIFGHVALEVQNEHNEVVYLSYAMRNNQAQDLSRLGPSQKVELPLLSDDAFEKYKIWWQGGPLWEHHAEYGKHYNLFRFNCAHAVSNALKFLNYNTGWADDHFALTPRQVWMKAKSFQRFLVYRN